jgi:2-(1,2-epoxy-1,2-dihydrophenyl)acetyl-CoA isomerase
MLNCTARQPHPAEETHRMPDSTVLFEERGAVALVTLNRPDALNSFTRRMHHDLWAALDQAEANPEVRALVVTGAGRGFCAGADLAEFDFAPGPDLVKRADPGPVIEQAFNPTARRLQGLRMPTIAAVNGVAAGAGASLAMCCDIAIAAPGASFIQAFSKIGLVPDCAGTWLLPRLVGRAQALGLAMTGDKLPAEEAARIGLIWRCVDDASFAAEVQALAQRLAQMPSRALAQTRLAIDAATTLDFDAALVREGVVQGELGQAHDFAEGVAAFRDKRPARFSDR